MKNKLSYIGFILVILVTIPALIFSVIEFSSLKENEKMIESIYNRQLDAILYSVNTFSESAVSDWQKEVENEVKNISPTGRDFNKIIKRYNNIITGIAATDKNYLIQNFSGSKDFENEIKFLLKNNSKLFEKLIEYYSNNYFKIETFKSSVDTNSIVMVFVTLSAMGEFNFIFIDVEVSKFIRQLLAPKLQEIGGMDLLIGIKEKDIIIYSTDNSLASKNYRLKKMWLLPEYDLIIAPSGKTIEELAAENAETNLLIILSVSVLLLFTAFLLFRLIKKELEIAKMRSDFVSNVSHELRTPLALISMFAETLELGRIPNEEKKKEYYSIISKETHRLSTIVNSILNFSKMEAGKRKYNFSEMSLKNLLDEIINNYSYHFEQKGFSIETNIDRDDMVIKGDKEALSEAIINLIDNAIKYSGESKKIILSAFDKNGDVIFSIKDFGIGISPKEQKKIFEKFYRSGSHLIHNTKGTGIGLSIVKQIIDAHGGEILVESQVDRGSTFTIKFQKYNS